MQQWAPGKTISELASVEVQPEDPKYDHGYSEEEVIRITEESKELDKRIEKGHVVTLKEFEEIVAPMFRISRKEAFILNKPKEKPVKEPKAPREKKEKIVKEKVPKVKKVTAKELKLRKEKLNKISMKLSAGLSITEEEKVFLDELGVEYG